MIDLSATLFVLLLLVLSFVGPWRLPPTQWGYSLYALTVYLAIIMVPQGGTYPLSSLARYMMEIFLTFVMLSRMGKSRNANLWYLGLALPLLAFLTLQWLTGAWTV